MKIAGRNSTLGIVWSSQDHGTTSNILSHLPQYKLSSPVNFDTGLDIVIKYVCSSDMNTPHL